MTTPGPQRARDAAATPATTPATTPTASEKREAVPDVPAPDLPAPDARSPDMPAPDMPTHRVQSAILVALQSLPVAGLALVYWAQMGTVWFWLGIALVAALGGAAFYARQARRMAFFEEVLLAQVFFLSLIGIALTSLSPQTSLRFWVALSVLMAAAGLVIGTVRMVEQKDRTARRLVMQIVHWGATLLTIGAIYELFRAGRLNYESTGLVLLLVLGLSVFLDGARISWRFALIGVVISLTAVISGFIAQYLWVMVFLIMVLLALVVAWEWRVHRR